MSWFGETNIWGKRGCELPNGGLCTACCIRPGVVLSTDYGVTNKPEHTPCPNLCGDGCALQKTRRKPKMCIDFHCGHTTADEKLGLIAQAFSMGDVTEGQAIEASQRVSRRDEDAVQAALQQEVIWLQQVTLSRPLEFGEEEQA